MLVYGEEDPRVKADINRIRRQLEPLHPSGDDVNANQPQSFVVVGLPSKLQGGTLISQVGPPIENQIIRFLAENVAHQEQPWFTRLNLAP
jgi:hypothetical protein